MCVFVGVCINQGVVWASSTSLWGVESLLQVPGRPLCCLLMCSNFCVCGCVGSLVIPGINYLIPYYVFYIYNRNRSIDEMIKHALFVITSVPKIGKLEFGHARR